MYVISYMSCKIFIQRSQDFDFTTDQREKKIHPDSFSRTCLVLSLSACNFLLLFSLVFLKTSRTVQAELTRLITDMFVC